MRHSTSTSIGPTANRPLGYHPWTDGRPVAAGTNLDPRHHHKQQQENSDRNKQPSPTGQVDAIGDQIAGQSEQRVCNYGNPRPGHGHSALAPVSPVHTNPCRRAAETIAVVTAIRPRV
ncbi:hypothetical protein Vse01_42050 [Micromonospora sediminimaris]|uniref:Uncharacterized protein n=1 Tax=Micromonospora sediminimaris TaxID=547162 RepID=A0A9W5XLH6_9ACTN|nr:hypothetical protein Vse01_42050 [Micromonospora sediminimaris]